VRDPLELLAVAQAFYAVAGKPDSPSTALAALS
jgi:hypothetical protein